MITRAIIEEKINEYKYRVRIPIFDGSKNSSTSTTTKDLCIAVASIPKGIYNSLQKDDVVIVGFENNNMGTPIIIGQLYRESLNALKEFPTITTDVLTVNNQVNLPKNTTIGTITYENLFTLVGMIDQLTKLLAENSAKLQEGDNNN